MMRQTLSWFTPPPVSKSLTTDNTPAAFAEFRKHSPLRTQESPVGRMVATKTVVHIAEHRSTMNNANRQQLPLSNLGACGRFWLSQC